MNANNYAILFFASGLKYLCIILSEIGDGYHSNWKETALRQDIFSWSKYLPTDFPENPFYFTTSEAVEYCCKMMGNATTCES